MSDIKTRLAATIQELHDELAAAPLADADVRQLLAQALGEIQAKLAAPSAAAIPTAPQEDSLTERLRGAALHFEGSHPTLTALINNVMDTLAQLGI